MDLRTGKLSTLKESFPNLPFKQDQVYWVANGGDDLCFLLANPFQYWRLTPAGFKLMCEMKKWDRLKYPNESWRTWGPECQFFEAYALLKLGNVNPQYFCTATTSTTYPFSNGVFINSQKELSFSGEDVGRQLATTRPGGATLVNFKATLNGDSINFFSGNFSKILAYTKTGGLFVYDFNSVYKLLSPGELGISTVSALYSFYIDRQNNIWLCTAAGLIKIKQEKNRFGQYFTKETLRDSSENQARGIYADRAGTVYASIWNKLYYSRGGKDKYAQIGVDKILYGLCWHMNTLYVGEFNLFRFKPDKTAVWEDLTRSNFQEIWAIDSLDAGKLLGGSTESIQVFDLVANKVKAPVYGSASMPKVQFVYRFIRKKNRQIWAVAQNGLFLMNEKADTLIDFFGKSSKDATRRLPFEIMHDAYEDADGVFWFATNGEGLYRWHPDAATRRDGEQEFMQFNSASGLPSDILYRIESDDFNNLWVSTDNGLVHFDTDDYKTHTYTTRDGVSHNEFNRASSFKAKDGRLFFGGLNGVNAFYPKDFLSDSLESNTPLRVVSFNQFVGSKNQLVDNTNDLLRQNKIVLQPGDKFFTIEFQLLDFEEGTRSYAYKIEGIDKDWNYINENSIRFSSLPYGDFTVHIKGQNFKGEWSKSELAIPVSVLRPFYKTVWFYLIVAACLVVLVYLFLFWRTRSLQKANARLEETVGRRTLQLQDSLNQKDMLLREIHHRVKNNLQIISSMLELQAANANSEPLRKALVEGQTRVSSIALIHHRLYEYDSLGQVEFNGFLNDLYKQVSAVFQKPGQRVEVLYGVPETYFDIDTIVPLGLIVNELLTNSFKYAFNDTAQRKIVLSMAIVQEGHYVFSYNDSGQGLPEGFDIQKGASLGLRLVYRLSKQLGGSVSYDKAKNTFFINFKDSTTRKENE
jgi:two-component sensor histidine kinase